MFETIVAKLQSPIPAWMIIISALWGMSLIYFKDFEFKIVRKERH
ncbi:MAG: hypothetical protein ACRDDE_05905 [Paraclostridium sp.]